MRHLVIKDQSRRRKQNKFEIKRRFLLYLKSSNFFNPFIKEGAYGLLEHMGGAASFRSRNRCLLTKRSKAVYRFFGLERRVLRQKLRWGAFPGFKRVLW